MLKLVLFVGLVGAAGWLFPQFYEGTSNACTAAEAKLARLAQDVAGNAEARAAMALAMRFSNGDLARAAVAENYPNLPTGLGCVVGYYDLDPSDLRV
ncbi:hypothetical protein LGT41_0004620 [Abyssibius alkaniclasticus]|uniref:hypothetical protein n=1 Tax=Abyssibius alkaniclasticus TaxID=2881234 RepID=UPI002363584B|nr:hypothetical protein [Abyssibius alkaniclasticus]UPH72111.1 hypothetical protein LGT41_0004620 [Abyssibius alkaniclasticus]|tara:strand:- start:1042 stop:1332 length:291 start_codon:yes stop_codon:yes gene_type:complete